MRGLVLPEEGWPFEIDVDDLEQLQAAVHGNIEALPLPPFLKDRDRATAYINDEGKYHPECLPNMRATDFFVPGVGLFFGDHIAGPCVFCGFDPATGEHAELPQEVLDRVMLIVVEAG